METRLKEDIQYIKETLDGDSEAFRFLVKRYERYVFTLTHKILRNVEDAEEAAQDTFLKVYQNLDKYEERAKFSTWLYAIAYRAAIDRQRRSKAGVNGLLSTSPDERIIAVEDRPDQSFQNKQQGEIIQMALDSMNPDDAILISLFYLQEQSVKEISTILGLDVSNIKVKLFRSREKMRKLLSGFLNRETAIFLEENN